MEKYYTVEEVAQMFKVNRWTVLRWISEGVMKAVPISGDRNYRMSSEDIEDFLILRGKKKENE